MYLTPDIKLQHNLRETSKYLSGFVLLVAILVLAGWQFNIEFFKRLIPNLVAMNPATGIAFIFSSVSFLLFTSKNTSKQKNTAAALFSFLVFVIGIIKFIGIIFDVEVHVDTILFSDKLQMEVGSISNRMAPNTAFNFILTGVALFFLKVEFSNKRKPSHYIALLISLLALLSILGYVFRVEAFYGILTYIPMAIHTAVCFLFIALAILFANPENGAMKEFTSTFAGSITARRLIPAAIVVPVVLGFVRLLGHWSAVITTEFGVAILVLSIIVIFFGLIWYNAALLNKRDYQNKLIEEEVEQTNKFLSTILENIPNMIFVKDAEELRFVRFNKAGEKLLGYSHQDLLGKNDYDFFPKEQADFFISKDRDVFSKGELLDIEEEPIATSTGQRWLHTKKIPIFDEKGKALYLIGISEDITERRKQEDAIRQLNKELEAFTYSVSHDLRAPLRSINGFTQMLEEDYKDKLDEEGIRLCHVVQKNAQKMGELIDDLLAFSRLGRQELQKSSINMEQLVKNVLAEIQKTEPAGLFTVTLKDLLPAKGDYSLMQQVFINLLSNAVKYSHKTERPVIEIGSEVHNNEHVYYVKDNGVGFDMQYSNKLFGVFQRLHKPSEFEGTGVGLAIAQRIVTKHGGRIWADAKVNEGATFYFSLPK